MCVCYFATVRYTIVIWSRKISHETFLGGLGFEKTFCLLCSDKSRVKQKTYMSVGLMKDEKLNLRDLHVSHTLGCVGDWNT